MIAHVIGLSQLSAYNADIRLPCVVPKHPNVFLCLSLATEEPNNRKHLMTKEKGHPDFDLREKYFLSYDFRTRPHVSTIL